MFTGIIEAIGSVQDKLLVGGDLKLTLNTGSLDMADVQLGDSIATNGVCLTVIDYGADYFVADVSQETLHHSRLTELSLGEPVNLEKALLPTTRLGGHLVSGHVDGLAELVSLDSDARSVRLRLKAPAELAKYIAHKGSITIDGVSLTVNKVDGSEFELNVVPHTAANTIIRYYRAGQKVHLEVDMIARYLERLMGQSADTASYTENETSGVTMELLASSGYLRRR